MLNITKTIENGTASIAVEGRLDTVTAPRLEEAIKESLDGVTTMLLDFEKLEYISSAGLRVLLSAQKAMSRQGEMKILNICETIQDIFEVTGFSEILTVEA